MLDSILECCFQVRLVERAEMAGLVVFSAVLAWVGNKTTMGRPAIRNGSWVLAAVAFLGLLGLWVKQDRMRGDALADLTIRGLLGCLALFGAICVIGLPISALYRATVRDTLRRCASWVRGVFEWRRRRREEKRRAAESARGANAREEQRIHAEKQGKANALAQRRREEARASCEVLFVQHAFELRQRFTREMFEAFLAKYMADAFTPDHVEQRAAELREVIQAHLAKVSPPQKNLAELAKWFLDEKRQIEESALGEDDRALMLAQLEERYVRLQEKYLRSVNP